MMSWLNWYGLAIMTVIMIPNVIYAAKHRGGFANAYRNKVLEICEQIGRYACLFLMIFHIPYFGFWFDNAIIVYLFVNIGLCLSYLLFWVICWERNGRLKALSLSIIPTVIFLFSGIMLAHIPLVFFAVIFGTSHIIFSCKNQMGR